MDSANFWQALDTLIAESTLVIDRPKGSHHPRYLQVIYPLNYGYLAGTQSPDGDPVDVWRGSEVVPRLMGVVMTVDLAKRDAEMKLLVGCTPAEILVVYTFHNRDLQHGKLVLRED